jgi:hypothetical protein
MASLNLAKFCCLNSDCDYYAEFAFENIKRCGNIPKTGAKRIELFSKYNDEISELKWAA